jgi:ubiquinone/menaquinone biosynthesis C-methylase UbiE
MTFQLVGNGPQIYEEVMVPLWFGRWADQLVDVLSLRTSERVLDVACGTGVTTRIAKQKVGASGWVDGLDINASMLATAKDLAQDVDINWIESDVCESGLAPETYDVILSQHGYHYFPDQPAALREFHRLLKRGGRMGFSVWDGHSAYTEALCAAVERHISPEIAAKQRAQRQTPSVADLQKQVTDAGFSKVEVQRQELLINVPDPAEFVPLHLASMPIAAAFLALSQEDQAELVGDVATALGDCLQDDRLIYPDAVHVAIGHK